MGPVLVPTAAPVARPDEVIEAGNEGRGMVFMASCLLDVGDACGRDGRGRVPPRRDGDGLLIEGEEDRVDDLNGLSGFSCGRRIGRAPGEEGRSCIAKNSFSIMIAYNKSPRGQGKGDGTKTVIYKRSRTRCDRS